MALSWSTRQLMPPLSLIKNCFQRNVVIKLRNHYFHTKSKSCFSAITTFSPSNQLKFHSQRFCFRSFNSNENAENTGEFDVAIIGGGPGGYVAAIKAGQLGLSTVCIEQRGSLGGTCLNVGCIPSKALLNATHKYDEIKKDVQKYGISLESLQMNVAAMMKYKSKVVTSLTGGVEFLLKKNKVTYIKGKAKITSGNSMDVKTADGKSTQKYSAKNIVIATGSECTPLPGTDIVADGKIIITSDEAIALSSVPNKLVVVGGGAIGLELGSVWSRLGSEVHVVEFLNDISPSMDLELSRALQKSLVKQGVKFHMSTKVVGVDVANGGATLSLVSSKDGKTSSLEADTVLVSVGRRPYTAGLGLAELGIELDKGGRVIVDEEFRTSKFHSIRAIGDVITGPMLAHKAEEEGIAVIELIAGKGAGHVNYSAIPSVIYTHPEAAGVGATEEELKASGASYNKGIFPFSANSRAKTNDEVDGFVKILSDKNTDQLLGGWILGTSAGELIQQLVIAKEYGAAAEDVGRTTFAHPTLSEAVKEACMAAYGKPIHYL